MLLDWFLIGIFDIVMNSDDMGGLVRKKVKGKKIGKKLLLFGDDEEEEEELLKLKKVKFLKENGELKKVMIDESGIEMKVKFKVNLFVGVIFKVFMKVVLCKEVIE